MRGNPSTEAGRGTADYYVERPAWLSRVAPEIPQPSAKTLKAVEKLVSYMKAKAAKNTPDPKEPKGPRARSDASRFVGVGVNEGAVPRLPIFPAQWALDDPRQRPYLVVWGHAKRPLDDSFSRSL